MSRFRISRSNLLALALFVALVLLLIATATPPRPVIYQGF
jgi:hypothetical protein